MGDYGRLYPTYDQDRAESMRSFLDEADILTPNLTEACFLADVPYRTDFTDAELDALCARLAERNGSKVVVSGIPRGDATAGTASFRRTKRGLAYNAEAADGKVNPGRSGQCPAWTRPSITSSRVMPYR